MSRPAWLPAFQATYDRIEGRLLELKLALPVRTDSVRVAEDLLERALEADATAEEVNAALEQVERSWLIAISAAARRSRKAG